VKQEGEDPFFKPVCSLVSTAVHEEVFAPGVAMDVTIKKDVPTLKGLAHHLLA
jgi:hypothetical protein